MGETGAWPAGGGETGALIRARDGSSTPLGPTEHWPHRLRTAVEIMLASPVPTAVMWGPTHVLLYNDAYVGIARERHPAAFGRPALEVWPEAREFLGPIFRSVLEGGPPVVVHDQGVPLRVPGGGVEERVFTATFSAIPGESGGVGGIFHPLQETTAALRTQAALRESEERFRLMADAVPQIVWITDAEGRAEFFNRQWTAYTGRPYEPTTAAEVASTSVHPDDAEVTLRRFDEARRSGGPFQVEHRIRSASGEYRWFLVRGEPHRDPESGHVTHWFGASVDIHDRRVAEEALRESEARYRTLFESIDDGFCVVEVLFGPGGRAADYRFLEANPAFEVQTGLSGVVGKTMRELASGIEEHWFEAYGRVARTGQPVRFESRAEALGRWFDVFAFRVGEPEKHHVAILFADVTGHRRAREERERLLRDAQAARAEAETAREQLGRIFQHAPACIATLRGPDHVFEMANPLYQELVGRRELVGKPAREAVPELVEQGYIEPLDQVYRTGRPFAAVEAQVFFARGTGAPLQEYFFNFVYQPLTDAGGAVTGILAYGADVTPQVRARREIEAARAEAEAANRAKSEFLAVMSHELRTPLNAIGGYAELMEMGIRGPVTAEQRGDLHRIQQSQRHLLGLINEVLNYARLESGAVRFDLEDVAVADAISAAVALLAPQAGARGLVLDVPRCPPELAVCADPDKLRQILLNLLSNAVKFTANGGRVELECQVEERCVRLRVRDTGIGIPHDQLERIFEPFVQVRADLTRTAEGTGLGLAISRDLARGMAGDLSAESTVGQGSTFTLVLPRA